MRLPRVRLTTRRSMVAVVLVAGLLCSHDTYQRRLIYRQRLHYYTLAEYLYRPIPNSPEAQALWFEANNAVCYLKLPKPGLCRIRPTNPGGETRRFADHLAALKRKYAFAARYPFLPVRPDPPEPE